MNKLKENVALSAAGFLCIQDYVKEDQVVLDKTMKFYLNMLKGQFEKITSYYQRIYKFDEKELSKIEGTLSNFTDEIFLIDKNVEYPDQDFALMIEDYKLLVILKNIAYRYSITLEKAKNLPKEVKTHIKKVVSYYYGYEKYVVNM